MPTRPCAFTAWAFLPADLRRRLRSLPSFVLMTERLAHLADRPRCPCMKETP